MPPTGSRLTAATSSLAAEAEALKERRAAAAAHLIEVGDMAEYDEDGNRWGVVIYAGRERVFLACCPPNVRVARFRREEVRFYRRAKESDITSRLRDGSITLEARRGLRAALQVLRGEPVELNPNEEDEVMAKKTAKKAARAKAPARAEKKAAPKKASAKPARRTKETAPAPATKGGGRFEHPSLVPGSELRRTFKDKEIVVKVVEGGFEYEGQTFKSISAVAKHIVGYMISGPVFFHLDKATAASTEG